MNNVFELLQKINLTDAAERLLQFVDASDPIFIAVVLGILVLLGSKMAAPFPKLRSWGLRLAAAVFLVHFGFVCFTQGIQTNDLLRTVLRSVNVAGFVLAPLWIFCPVLFFAYNRIRLALAAFLLYCGYAFIASGAFQINQLPRIALEGVVAAGLALVVAWIVQPITDYVVKNWLPRREPVSGEQTPQQLAWQQMQAEQPVEQSRQIRQTAAELLNLKKTQLRQETEQQAGMNRRRQRARLKAELCYTLNEPALAVVFPRALFEDFMARYLNDQHDAETVEENAKELEAMILQHINNQPIPVEPINLDDLNQWFVDEQVRIRHDEGDHGRKKTKIAGLTRRYTQLAEQLLEEDVN